MPTDAQSLLAAANCYQCYSSSTNMLLMMKLSLLKQLVLQNNPNAAVDANSLLQQAQCFQCYSSNANMLLMIELALLAQIAGSGGVGGGGAVTCGAAIPVAAPSGTCGFYIRQNGAQSALYAWDGSAWQAVVGT